MNTATYNVNPYFNAEPTLFFTSLKVLGVVSTLTIGISLYIIAFKSPPFMSRVFIGLLLYHFSIASLTVITVSVFSNPIVYLPYTAIKYVGTFSSLNIAPHLQFSVTIMLLLTTGSTAIPLFYYRMDAILPPGHILNSKSLRYFVYIVVYAGFNFLPAPAIYAALVYEDQNKLKQDLLRTFSIYYEDFMSDQIVATRVDGSNPIATIIVYTLIFICSLGIAVVVISCYVIWQLTSKVGVFGSARYKAQQRQLFLSLVIMTSFFIPVLTVILPTLLMLLIVNSYRTDIINMMMFLGLLSIPMAISSYVFTYKPYRRFIFGLFRNKKSKVEPARVSTPFVVTKALFHFTSHR